MAFQPQDSNSLKDMNQSQLIAWIESLSLTFKGDIVSGIKSYAQENGTAIYGQDFIDADCDDIREMTGIARPKAMRLMKKIAAKRQSDISSAAPSDKNNNMIFSFDLNICGYGGKRYCIRGVNKNWTISNCKYEFLREMGNDGKAQLYAEHANPKWVSPDRSDGIQLKKNGKDLSDNATLGSIGIVNGIHLPLVTSFRVYGGSPLEVNHADWTPLYHKCMVCSAKGINNLSKGYWHHPGGDKAYFRSSKSNSGCIVEMKGNKIRCDGCKKECNYSDWQFKCDNHDFQKIQ